MNTLKMLAACGFIISFAFLNIASADQTSDNGGRAGKVDPAAIAERAAAAAETNFNSITPAPEVGFPAGSCRAGYTQYGARLCMRDGAPGGKRTYANAAAYCRVYRGRVATYEDWRYAILYAGKSPFVGDWLGLITDDNTALFVNKSDDGDFDGETSRFDSRYFFCAHDDDV